MEDEECLPENSSLKIYLQSLGFSDVQVTESCTQNSGGINFVAPKCKSGWSNLESIDEGVLEQIGILISTQMLFEEDISNIEKLLSGFKVVKNGMLQSMFQGAFGVAVIFLGLCLYWVIGSYTFLIVSSFYAYRATDYLWKKHFNQFRLKKLAAVLQANFFLLKKAVKFIEENNKVLECNYPKLKNSTDEVREAFSFYNNFKSDFLLSMNEMVNILSKSTKKLIKKIPLCDYLENPQYYLCNNLNLSSCGLVELSKLYQIYLLVQSEFLQRLILSLIPNIKLSKHNNFQDINKILTETCVNLLKIKNNLNKKFKFIFLNGIHCPKSKMKFKSPKTSKSITANYIQEFASNIHDTSNTFQNLLIKSRSLEENLNEKIPENLENELTQIQDDLNFCQKNIADSFILLKKANFSPVEGDSVKVEEYKETKFDNNLDKISVGYSDLEPKVEDEIFEAYFNDDNLSTNLSNEDDWNFEDKLKKKMEEEYSRSVMKELKGRLVEKAKEWEKREAELLKKKGKSNGNDFNTPYNKNEVELTNISEQFTPEVDFEKCKAFHNLHSTGQNLHEDYKKYNNDFMNEKKERIKITNDLKNKIFKEELIQDNTVCDILEPQQNCIGVNEFLSDIMQARQKMFATTKQNEDEFYCESGESSEGEEE